MDGAPFCVWGYAPTGQVEKSQPTMDRLCKRMFWFDKHTA